MFAKFTTAVDPETVKRFGGQALNYSYTAVGFIMLSTLGYVVGRKATRLSEMGIGAASAALRSGVTRLDDRLQEIEAAEAKQRAAGIRQKKAISDAVDAEIARRVAAGQLFSAAPGRAAAE